MNWCVVGGEGGGVMLARGKTEVGSSSYPGCCCYCDLYSLAEWAYRDKLSYPPAPLPYAAPMPPPCPEHGGGGHHLPPPEGVSDLHAPHKHMSPDVATAFLLSLDLLRPYPHQQALHALESHALKHACHRRSSSYGTPGEGEGDGGLKGGGCGGGDPSPLLVSSASHPANLHMPHYHVDASVRAPGVRVENAPKFPDMPLPPTPTPSPAPTPTSSAIHPWLPLPLPGPYHGGGCHNGEGGGGGGGVGGGGTEGGGGPDEEELGAFWEILENDIRPIKPLPSCPESQKIFSEHKEMARKYLVLQQEIFNLRKHKSILENKLSQAEKLEQLGNQRYQDKIRELESKRENLYHNQSRLKQQLEQICTRQEEQQKRQLQQDDGNDVGLDHLPLAPP